MEDILTLYTQITKENELADLNSGLSFYQGDKINTDILSSNIIEIDIVSAFPTILKILYGEDHNFVKDVFSIEDKLKRNIHISTTLSNDDTINDLPYRIADLNTWCKIIIFGYVHSIYNDVNVFEYKKDSLLFGAEEKRNSEKEHHKFVDFLIKHEVQFHEKKIKHYIRSNKTSYFFIDQLSIKGVYKNMPVKLKKYILSIFSGELYNKLLLNEIKYNYSLENLHILVKSGLVEDYQQLFAFGADQYLDINGQLKKMSSTIKILDDCLPSSYLRVIVYPILSLLRMEK